MLLRLVGLMKVILILPHSIIVQGREPSLDDSYEETLTVANVQTFYRPISFKFGFIIEVYCLMPV